MTPASTKPTRVFYNAKIITLDPLLPVAEAMAVAGDRQDREGNPQGSWHPRERLTPMEALTLFTTGSAYAAHEEAVKGSPTAGKLADFVVLPADPTKIYPDELLNMQVTATYVGGNKVFPHNPSISG